MKLFAVFAVCMLTLYPAEAAFAATVTENYRAEIRSASYFPAAPVRSAVRKFDSSLGQLWGIERKVKITYGIDVAWDLSRTTVGGLYFSGEHRPFLLADLQQSVYNYYLVGPHEDFSYYAPFGTVGERNWGNSYELTSFSSFFGVNAEDRLSFTGNDTFIDELQSGFWFYGEVLSGPPIDKMEYSAFATYDVSFVYYFGVPEPAAWAFMICGFFGTGVALRRRGQMALVDVKSIE